MFLNCPSVSWLNEPMIPTLAAWWTVDGTTREGNGPQLCYHGGCLCWSPWLQLVPSPLSGCPQKCPRGVADSKLSYGSEFRGNKNGEEPTHEETFSELYESYKERGLLSVWLEYAYLQWSPAAHLCIASCIPLLLLYTVENTKKHIYSHLREAYLNILLFYEADPNKAATQRALSLTPGSVEIMCFWMMVDSARRVPTSAQTNWQRFTVHKLVIYGFIQTEMNKVFFFCFFYLDQQ